MTAKGCTLSRRHGAQRSAGGTARRQEVVVDVEFQQHFQHVLADEWDAYVRAVEVPPPVVVRVNRKRKDCHLLESSLASDGRWTSVPWCAGAWSCQARDFDDALKEQCGALHKSYRLRTHEASLLVAPLLLGLDDQQQVLDMSAGDGTLHCLELMREGIMVANDANAERAFEVLPMVTRKARHPGTIVTLINAAKFPALFEGEEPRLFDRVLCSVPCADDMRKPSCAWSAELGLSFHRRQVQTLSRGLHLLRPGGFLVYSTCSINPVENEAVVAAVLSKYGVDVSLVHDPCAALVKKGLSVSRGLARWNVPVPGAGGLLYASWSATPDEHRRPRGHLSETMFAPTGDAAHVLVQGCARIYPHLVEGCGLFVAVFEKRCHRLPPLCASSAPQLGGRLAWRARNDANHYEIIDEAHDDIKSIADFYGIEAMPSPMLAEFNTKGRFSQVNLISDALLKFLQSRMLCKVSPLLISVGVPLFKPLPDNFMTEIELPSRWRPALEGVEFLVPLMRKRVVRMSDEALDALIAQRLLTMEDLARFAASGDVWSIESCESLLGGVIAVADAWAAPCVVTGRGLELFASADEVGRQAVLRPQIHFTTAVGSGYVVVNKPSGLRTEEVLKRLRDQHPCAELVSRLDKQTSGCLLVPTTTSSAASLTRQFAGHTVQKTYLALVWGCPGSGCLDLPLSLAEGGGGSRYRAHVDVEGKPAETRYATIWAGHDASLVAVSPVTGRTHQIRCHFEHAGFPLVGDTKYGGKAVHWCGRLPLHCFRVEARDESGAPIDEIEPLPEDFSSILDGMPESCEWRNAVAALQCKGFAQVTA